MGKLAASPAAAVADIKDGASVGIAGFGVAHRFPSSLIIALRDQGSAGLTVYCNGLGQPGFPTAHLLADSHQISHLATCFSARPGVVSEAERQIRAGQMSLELVPQGTPAKYTFCIAENEEESPWPPLHTEFGLAASDSAVTAMVIRSCVHIEARHTRVPEQLATDIAGTISRTGALIHETISAAVVLSPEHARLFSAAGWGRSDLRQFLFDHAARTRAELAAAGKEAVSSRTRWRLPADHPDALPLDSHDGVVRVLNSPAAVLVVVAGAGNAGVSAVVETFGPRGGPPPVTRVREIISG
jgi:hypothetical protein